MNHINCFHCKYFPLHMLVMPIESEFMALWLTWIKVVSEISDCICIIVFEAVLWKRPSGDFCS